MVLRATRYGFDIGSQTSDALAEACRCLWRRPNNCHRRTVQVKFRAVPIFPKIF
jgi:hypothetical protein